MNDEVETEVEAPAEPGIIEKAKTALGMGEVAETVATDESTPMDDVVESGGLPEAEYVEEDPAAVPDADPPKPHPRANNAKNLEEKRRRKYGL